TGWNTSASATTSSLNVGATLTLTSNPTYYAITKKVVTMTYAKDSTVSAVGATSGTCTIQNTATTCAVTLPTITPLTGYTTLGWYNGTTKVGNASASVNVSANATYTAKASDVTKPTISLSPNTQTTYVSGGKAVTVNLADSGSGLKANQPIYYAWSTSNATVPSSWSSVTSTNTAGAKSASVTVPATSNSSLTGTYYLWIKAGTLSDVSGNTSNQVVSALFKFDNTNPTVSVSTSKTTKSITAVATASATSGISKYEFSKDNGATWVANGTSNTYTFTGLTHKTAYNIKSRVTSGVGRQTSSATVATTTNSITVSSFSASNDESYYCPSGYTSSGSGSSLVCSQVVTTTPNNNGSALCQQKCSAENFGSPSYQNSICSCSRPYQTMGGTSACSSSGGSISGVLCVWKFSMPPTSYSCPSGYTSSGSGSSMTCSKTATVSKLTEVQKKVVVSYPSGCGTNYTCSYSKDGGSFVEVSSNPTILFNKSGSLVSKISDGINTVSNSYSVQYGFISETLEKNYSCSNTSLFECNSLNIGKKYTTCGTNYNYDVQNDSSYGGNPGNGVNNVYYYGSSFTFNNTTGKFTLTGTTGGPVAGFSISVGQYIGSGSTVFLVESSEKLNAITVGFKGKKYSSYTSSTTYTCNIS
ncbi:MAG: hypothetical protein ACLTAK_06255, partial [Bacilli bacterium]